MSQTAALRLPHRFARAELSAPLAAGWIACLALYGALAFWLAAHPAALASDDALNFTRALTHFDILDFAPQFPGYPGFVALGRLMLPFFAGPPAALLATTTAIALALPPAAAWLAWQVSGRQGAVLAAFAVTLTQPLLPDLALSMLSDGSGILFLLVALACLSGDADGRRGRLMPWFAGLAFGWGLCCRPSDAPLYAGAFAAIAWRLPTRLPALIGGALVAGLPTFAVVYACEGPLYLWEAVHFVSGHATDWGNTPFSAGGATGNWLASIGTTPGAMAAAVVVVLAVAGALWRIRSAPPALAALTLAFVAHAVWIALMQNPDHLRHLAPLTVLGGLVLVLVADRPRRWFAAAGLLIALDAITLAHSLDPMPDRPPPLARAAGFLGRLPDAGALAVNDGVAVLRRSLPAMHVFDMQHGADTVLGIAAVPGAAFRLSTTPLAGMPAAVFAGRVYGETTMYLYRLDKNSAQPASD